MLSESESLPLDSESEEVSDDERISGSVTLLPLPVARLGPAELEEVARSAIGSVATIGMEAPTEVLWVLKGGGFMAGGTRSSSSPIIGILGSVD